MIRNRVKCSFIFCVLLSYPSYLLRAQSINKAIDYHIHLFSPQLIENLKKEKYGSEMIKGDPSLYSEIETILKLNPVAQMVLISTGYGFRLNHIDPADEIPLIMSEQNYLSNISKKYPDRIFPFYGIHPLRPYTMEAIKRCHTILNFTGIKLHFSASQVDFRKEEHISRLRDIFIYTGQHQIPVLIHFSNHRSDFGKKEVIQFFHDVLDPDIAQTIIFAHMGAGGWITDRSVITIESILNQVESSTGTKHHIYFELSGIIHEKWNHQEEISDYQKNILIRRIGLDMILFGSDYPATTSLDYLKLIKRRLKFTNKEMNQISRKNIFAPDKAQR